MSIESQGRRGRALGLITALQLIVFIIVLAVPVAALAADPSAAATIQSDKADYPPAGHVILSGSNWLPGEDVHILVDDLDAHSWQYSATVPADLDGNVANEFDLPNMFVANYIVTADGSTSARHADWAFTDAVPKADLDSCANGAAPSPSTDGCTLDGDWVNGDLVSNKANYFEGDSVPFRVKMDNIPTTGTHTLTLTWDTTKSGNHTFDYLTTYTQTVATANACAGQTCGTLQPFGAANAIPADPQVTGAGVTPTAGNFSMWGATITTISAYSGGATFPAGDNDRSITITFTAAVANPVLAFAAHIASRDDWGEHNAAVSVPGSPFHVESGGVDGQGGTQSHQVKLDAITFPGSITIIKDASPNSSQSFAYTASPTPLTAFNLVDDGTSSNTKVFSDIVDFQTYTVNETPLPSGWDFDSVSCEVTSENGGSYDTNGTTATIDMEEGENWTCTYLNSAARLKLVKSVTNNNGGNDAADGWTLSAAAASPNNARNFSNLGGSGAFTLVFPGVQYTLSESPNPGTGYSSTGIWSCTGGTFSSPNKITVLSGTDVTCTIVNDDVAPTLALDKTVTINNNGGATENDFVLSATPTSGTTITDAGGDVPATTAQSNVVYTLSESGPSGYTPSSWTCTGTGFHQTGNTVTLDEGAVASCAITNTDDPASLTLVKHVVKDNGGTASASAWTLHAGANAVTGSEAGTVATTQAGTYALSETGGVGGYTNTLISCSDNPGVAVTSVTVALGESKTCTFVNDDDAAKLTLIKHVVNDDNGPASASDWTLNAGAHSVAGSETGNVATNQAGTYALTESTVAGYTNTSITCSDNPNVEVTSVTIGLGETKSCTFVNDDQPGTLIVKKLVVNDDTGTSIAKDFGFKVNGGSTTSFIQDGGDTLKGKNTLSLDAGTYTVIEPAFPGYSTTYSNCSNIVVGNGETKTCTVTNYDDPAVEDDVINPHGSIFGPCGDPAYAGIFDNTDSTVKIRFKFTWRTTKGMNKIVKMVPSGAIYKTVLRWAKPNTVVRVFWQDPDTGVWNLLEAKTAVKGRYGMCSDWVPGWTYAP